MQLLDEMIDNGFPLTTEPNILREMIAAPNIVSKMLSVVTGNSSNVNETLPAATALCVPWRTTDPKYANNEVYVDLVEEMDAVINRYLAENLDELCSRFLSFCLKLTLPLSLSFHFPLFNDLHLAVSLS